MNIISLQISLVFTNIIFNLKKIHIDEQNLSPN